jgi:hypothetical protein
VGASAGRLELLSVVEAQIEDIHRELDVQTKRMAQLQVQVDEMRVYVRQLVGSSQAAIDRLQAAVDSLSVRSEK